MLLGWTNGAGTIAKDNLKTFIEDNFKEKQIGVSCTGKCEILNELTSVKAKRIRWGRVYEYTGENRKTFKENNINYFKSNNSDRGILSLPYRGIKDSNEHLTIYLEVDEKSKVVIFNFMEVANKKIERSQLQQTLLELNASAVAGSLSMWSDSDTIEYRLDYEINDDDDDFSFSLYNRNIVRCINMYERLKEMDLV